MDFDIGKVLRKQMSVYHRSVYSNLRQRTDNLMDVAALVICVAFLCVYIYGFRVTIRLLTVKRRKKDLESKTIYNKDICPICFDEFDTAIKIPCGHVYCFNCLKAYITYQENVGKIQCALCRSDITSFERLKLVEEDHSVRNDISLEEELSKLKKVKKTYLCTVLSVFFYFISWVMVVYSVNRYYVLL